MGIFSKVWKGIKKVGKKIAKGVKKVFNKIGSAIGKLGIVGQIGMMFLMPYAIQGLGSFFGTAGKLSSWSQTLLGKSNLLAKGLGHGLNLINKAGTFVGNVYNSVSGTISEAFDRAGNFLKGRGFVKTPVTPDSLTAQLELAKPVDITTPEGSLKLLRESEGPIPGLTDVSKLGKPLDIVPEFKDVSGILEGEAFKPTKVDNFFELSAKDFDDVLIKPIKGVDTTAVVSDTTGLLGKPEQGLFERIKEDIKDFDIYETAKSQAQQAVFAGTKQALTQKTAEAFGYEQPEGADFYTINLPEMTSSYAQNRGVFGDIDFTMTKGGNPYMSYNFANSNYLNNLIGDGNDAYNAYMANFAASQYSPMQRSLNPAMGF